MPIIRDDPYAQSNFRVDIAGVASSDATRVDLPCASTDEIDHREGAEKTNSVRKQPGLTRFSPVTLHRGLDGRTDFYDWWAQVRDGVNDPDRTVVVALLDEANNEVWRWIFLHAFPVAYCFRTLDANGTDIVVESLSLAFDTMRVE